MFVGWAKLFIFTKTGFDLEITLIFIFWSYPVFIATFNLPMSEKWGGRFAFANIIAAIFIIINIATKHIFGFSVHIDVGAWIYLSSSLLLCIGIVRYKTATQIIEKLGEVETIHPVVNIPKTLNNPEDSMLTTLKDKFTNIFSSSLNTPSKPNDINIIPVLPRPWEFDSSSTSVSEFDKVLTAFESHSNNLQDQFEAKVFNLQDHFEIRVNNLQKQLIDSKIILDNFQAENTALIERLNFTDKNLTKISNQIVITLSTVIVALGVIIWRIF